MAMKRMLAKLSCRRDQAGMEPVGAEVTARARSTSKSAVSRRFVTATETALAELLARDLLDLDLVALMVDGVHSGDHLCVVALGNGTTHPLAVVEGATTNTTTVTDLLVGLRDRGLDVTRPILVVIDGAKALRSAVEAVFDCPVVARGQLHNIRNVQSKLPDRMAATVGTKARAAYKLTSALEAEATLVELARQLDRSHPGAAGSLREGLAKTLTVIRLRVPPTLARTLRSTNAIESMIEICRDHSTNVTHFHQRHALAGRDHGASMVRSRDERSRHTVPPGQRTPPPPRPAHRPPSRSRPPARRPLQYESHTPQLRSEHGLNRPPTVTEVPRNSGVRPEIGRGCHEMTF